PLARDLEHLVAAPAVAHGSVGVDPDQVARDVPRAAKGLRRLLHVLPVADRARLAAHPEPAGLAGWHLASLVVARLDLEARHDLPERAGAHVSRAVGDEDVPHLGCAEPVEQLDAEGFHPAP